MNTVHIKGIALIQILLISAVISVLALYLTQTAKSQVTQASWINDKATALIAIHDVESEILFLLLTEDRQNFDNNRTGDIAHNHIKQQWNFFAKTFKANEYVNVTLQDQAGLIHANYPNRENLERLLLSNSYSNEIASRLVDNLLDWQDIDSIPRENAEDSEGELVRNGPIPFIEELLYVSGVDRSLMRLLKMNMTLYRGGDFNPTNSPRELLEAITNKSAAEQVIELRNKKQLTKRIFTQITGIKENDNTFFYPSNFVEINLTSKVNDSVVQKDIIVKVSPYATGNQPPINILLSRR